jgi:hypothetical protein
MIVNIKILMLSSFASLPIAALPAMAQTNMPPADPNTTGTPGGTTTTQSGKTVEAPPQPPPGSNGGGQGR